MSFVRLLFMHVFRYLFYLFMCFIRCVVTPPVLSLCSSLGMYVFVRYVCLLGRYFFMSFVRSFVPHLDRSLRVSLVRAFISSFVGRSFFRYFFMYAVRRVFLSFVIYVVRSFSYVFI